MNQAATASVANPILNGIDTEALNRAVADVVANPETGMLTFRAKTSWRGSVRSRTEITSYDLAGKTIPRRHTIDVDEPFEVMGENTGPNPQDLLLSALASCMMVGFVVGATAEGIRIDSLDIHTECSLDLRGAFGIDPSIPAGSPRVKYTVVVRGSGTAEQFAAIHERVKITSPNYFHLSQPIAFDAQLIVG